MTSPTMTAEEQRARADLASAAEERRYWAGRATELEDAAFRMRMLAEDLHQQLDTLGDPMLPIRVLHTRETWEGNAATQSRQRLDVHEDRLNGAIRAINGIAASLSGEAASVSRQASNARTNESRYFDRMVTIEMELGSFDHI